MGGDDKQQYTFRGAAPKERNRAILVKLKAGAEVEDLVEEYGLSVRTIQRIRQEGE